MTGICPGISIANGTAMGLPWDCHVFMGFALRCHEAFIELSWHCHKMTWDVMGVPWDFHAFCREGAWGCYSYGYKALL